MLALIHMFALIGATLIVTDSVIFRPIRRLAPMLKCSQCVGFWIGAAAGAIGLVSLSHGHVLDSILVGCATSFLAQFFGAVLMNLLGEVIDHEEEKETHP